MNQTETKQLTNLFNKLVDASYQSIRKRGKITDKTSIGEFTRKMNEELNEIMDEHSYGVFVGDKTEKFYSEVIDLMNVCINLLRHHNIDIIELFQKVIKKNQTRED